MSAPEFRELDPPNRLLMGPGPANVHPRVLRAMSLPPIGYLDPELLKILDEVMELLRQVFRTKNYLTFPISGTGTAGMEAALYNLLEPGDVAVVGINGYFGGRMAEMASRCGARVVTVEAEWGKAIEPGDIASALNKEGKVKLVSVVHAETSTGVLQPLEEIGRLARAHEALFLVDAVTSLGGSQLSVDEWGVDVCYSGVQKCVGCPPGLSPITLSQRAWEAVRARGSKVQSWYLDLTLLEKYWGKERIYHHTVPMNMIYALHEALRMALEEGLEARIARHHRNASALRAGLEAMGLGLFASPEVRADPLTSVLVPDGVEELAVRRRLLEDFGIEIGGGLGHLRGRVWRIGLMGETSRESNVLLFLSALERVLAKGGYKTSPGAGVLAAQRVYASSENSSRN